MNLIGVLLGVSLIKGVKPGDISKLKGATKSKSPARKSNPMLKDLFFISEVVVELTKLIWLTFAWTFKTIFSILKWIHRNFCTKVTVDSKGKVDSNVVSFEEFKNKRKVG